MQCTSFYRDPYEHAAWHLYLRESALRVAREEVAFLEATGGATDDEIVRIRERVLHDHIKTEDEAIVNNNVRLLNTLNRPPSLDSSTVSLKSILVDYIHPDAVNQLCRRVRPLLEQNGIFTCKKHQALHVLQSDVQRVRDLSAGLNL
jgi:hypothetical protein